MWGYNAVEQKLRSLWERVPRVFRWVGEPSLRSIRLDSIRNLNNLVPFWKLVTAPLLQWWLLKSPSISDGRFVENIFSRLFWLKFVEGEKYALAVFSLICDMISIPTTLKSLDGKGTYGPIWLHHHILLWTY